MEGGDVFARMASSGRSPKPQRKANISGELAMKLWKSGHVDPVKRPATPTSGKDSSSFPRYLLITIDYCLFTPFVLLATLSLLLLLRLIVKKST